MLGLQPDEDALVAAVRSFDVRRLRRARALRRTFFVALAIFVLAGAANLLGGRTATATATSGGYELRVAYAAVGDIVQQGITQQDISLVGAMLGVGTITLWILVTSYLSFRFRRARPLVDGLPAVVVHDGRLNLEVIKIERLTVEEIRAAAREHGITTLRDVRLAIVEPEGQFTFIRRNGQPQQPPERHQEP